MKQEVNQPEVNQPEANKSEEVRIIFTVRAIQLAGSDEMEVRAEIDIANATEGIAEQVMTSVFEKEPAIYQLVRKAVIKKIAESAAKNMASLFSGLINSHSESGATSTTKTTDTSTRQQPPVCPPPPPNDTTSMPNPYPEPCEPESLTGDLPSSVLQGLYEQSEVTPMDEPVVPSAQEIIDDANEPNV